VSTNLQRTATTTPSLVQSLGSAPLSTSIAESLYALHNSPDSVTDCGGKFMGGPTMKKILLTLSITAGLVGFGAFTSPAFADEQCFSYGTSGACVTTEDTQVWATYPIPVGTQQLCLGSLGCQPPITLYTIPAQTVTAPVGVTDYCVEVVLNKPDNCF
jgi:hypothetical protein